MLAKPGSSTGRSRNQPQRRKAAESPDQTLRRLQKIPCNKRCCDCNSKLPSCVNLDVGSFVCISCAGIHREHSHKVKGVGHSTFTPEEVTQMENSDNDKVNAVYLANFNPSSERLRQPQDNSDLQLLRAWIKRKYHDKKWYQDNGAPASAAQPTMAQIPPKKQTAPQGDLLGAFDAPAANAPATAASNGGWDAFGGSNQNSQGGGGGGFQAANFPQQTQQQQGGFANFDQAPAPAPQQNQNQQHGGFANFNQAPVPAPVPQQHQGGFAAFDQASAPQQQNQQQQGGFANFNHAPVPVPAPVPQQQNQQQGGFANFDQAPVPAPAPIPQQQMPQQQQGFANFNQAPAPVPIPQQQQGFANFNQAPASTLTAPPQQQQQQQPPQQQFGNFNQNHHQQQQQPSSQQDQFGSFHQQPQLQQPQQQQPQQQQFSNFNQQQQHQPSQQFGIVNQHQQPPPQQDQFGSFNQQSPQQQPGGFGDFGQQQQPIQQQQQPGGLGDSNQQEPQQQQQQRQPDSAGDPFGGLSTVEDAPLPTLEQVSSFEQQPEVQPVPTKSSEQMQQSAMAGLQKLSMSQPTVPVSGDDQQQASAPAPTTAPDVSQKQVAKYSKGQEVYYLNTGVVTKARISKVHFDDDLVPFYDVMVDGKEKQTDDTHLSLHHPIQEEIAKVLESMPEAQLKQVLDYVKNMKGPGSSGMGAFDSLGPPLSSTPTPGLSASPKPSAATMSPLPATAGTTQSQGMPSPSSVGMNYQSNMTHGAPTSSAPGNGQGLTMPDLSQQQSATSAMTAPSMAYQDGNAGMMGGGAGMSFPAPLTSSQTNTAGQGTPSSHSNYQQEHNSSMTNQNGGQPQVQMQQPHMQMGMQMQPQQQPQMQMGMQQMQPQQQQMQGQPQMQQPQMQTGMQQQVQPQQQPQAQQFQQGSAAPQGNPFDFY